MSYLPALQLDLEPFSTSPDPAFFYRSAGHYAALNRLEIAIRLRRGLSLVFGDVGTGKTTLLRTLLQNFGQDEDDFELHMILNPSYKSEYQFLNHLTKIFGISPFFRSAVDHRDAIEKYLFQRRVEENKTVVLLIDEGQKLTDPCLETLRTILNYETNEQKMLQLVIFAQMELLPRVKKIKNLMDRASLKCMISPLDEYEMGKMIEFRLKQAGYSEERSLFTNEAINRIHAYSQGYPRKTAMICHQAMEKLVMFDLETVTAELIARILADEKIWL